MSEDEALAEPAEGELAAAIDVGTNTVLCLVGARGPRSTARVVDDRSEMPRLGEGLARSETLDPAAAERTLRVLEGYARRLDELGVPPVRRRAVSTAVLRRARDAEAFVREARERTGLAIDVLSGEDEARLGYAAVAEGRAAVVIDVGGGSTEVAWDEGRARASVPVGAVVLTELHGDDVEGAIASAREACLGLPEGVAGETGVIAIGGTAVNLACLALDLPAFDAERADGTRIEAPLAWSEARALAALPVARRAERPIEEGRAGVLPAGLACLGAALERVGAAEARVSLRGLRYGVLAELLGVSAV